MPLSACSNLPIWRSLAPVNDPFSWPKSSDSIRSSGIAAQFTCTNGPSRRRLSRCTARATSSLPTPLSPQMSTVALVGAAFTIAPFTAPRPTLSPTIWWRFSWSFRNVRFSVRRRRESTALRTSTSTRSVSSGFSRKSNAPSRVASTAVVMVPCPDITTIGVTSVRCVSRWSTSRPSMPGILMSRNTRSGASRSTRATPSSPVAAVMTA